MLLRMDEGFFLWLYVNSLNIISGIFKFNYIIEIGNFMVYRKYIVLFFWVMLYVRIILFYF